MALPPIYRDTLDAPYDASALNARLACDEAELAAEIKASTKALVR